MTSQIYFCFWAMMSRVRGSLPFSKRIISFDFTTENPKKRALFGLPVKPGNDVVKIRGQRFLATTNPNNSVYRLWGSV